MGTYRRLTLVIVVLIVLAISGVSSAQEDGAGPVVPAAASATPAPVASSAVVRSRTRFRALTASAALAADRRSHPGLIGRRPNDLLALRARVQRYLGARSALVRSGKGPMSVVDSPLPLTAGPHRAPIDLSLRSLRGGTRVANPLVPVAFAARAKGTSRLRGLGLGVRVGGARAVAARPVGGQVTYPNALRDTDVLVEPRLLGFEVTGLLRSPASPERIDLRVSGRVRLKAAPGGGIDLMRGRRRVGAISAPRAWDADGKRVAVAAFPTASGVRLQVRHRDVAVRYPVVVDPEFASFVEWRTNAALDFSGWTYEENNDFVEAATAGAGLKVDAHASYCDSSGGSGGPSGTISRARSGAPVARASQCPAAWFRPGHYAGDWGQWSYVAPSGTSIYRVDFLSSAHYSIGTCLEEGLRGTDRTWQTALWGPAGGSVSSASPYRPCATVGTASRTHCLISSCQPDPARPGRNQATTGMLVNADLMSNQGGTMSLGGARVFVHDFGAPAITALTHNPAAGSWASGTRSLTATFTDAGLGVKRADVKYPNAAGTAVVNDVNACRGDRTDRCPASWTRTIGYGADLLEGERTVTLGVEDLVGQRTQQTFTVKTDRGGPAITAGGALYDARIGATGERAVTDPTALTVAATDGVASPATPDERRAGVASVKLERQDATGAWTTLKDWTTGCASDNCALAQQTFDYDPAGAPDGPQTLRLTARDRAGNASTTTFQVRSDAVPPTVNLSGSLTTAATTLEPGDYDLSIAASDGGGLASIDVSVDGLPEDSFQPTCGTGACQSTYTYTFTGDAHPPGDHVVDVKVKDKAGKTSSKQLTVKGNPKNSPVAMAVGMEDWFETRSLATGAGSMAAVNLASGNLLWHHRLVANAGRGLSTNVDLTYNSLSSELDLGHGYEEAGEGFSLGVSSLTRVNEAMDVRAATPKKAGDVGVITLTDADGTMHRFTANAGGWFDPPPGVNLWLRKYHTSPATPDQEKRVWAATRPDGTTYFFDRCGYQRFAQDRNGNELTYVYDTSPAQTESGCHPQTQSAARPKLLKITDAGGRDVTFEYEPSAAVGHSKRITRITDHAGRKTEFAYYTQQTRLKSVTQAAGTAQARTFTFEYETTGGDRDITSIKDPLGNTTAVEYFDDKSQGGAPRFNLGERVKTLTDRAGKPTAFTYTAGTPYLETGVTDRRGKLWKYSTDTAFRLRAAVDPLGRRSEQDWDADNNPTVLRRAVGTADATTTTASFNANGLPLTFLDAENRQTVYTYRDSPGVHLSPTGVDAGKAFVSDVTQIKRPRNVTIGYGYDADLKGNPRSRTDEAGFRTEWDYGTGGVVVTERREIGLHQVPPRYAVTTYAAHDPSGLPQLVTDPRGNDTPTIADDGQWRMRYDAVGNLLDVRDPRSSAIPSATLREAFTTEYAYDALDRRISERVPKLSTAGQFIERLWEYDLNDNVKATVDGENRRFTADYTPRDDLEVERTPQLTHEGEGIAAAEETRYTYDPEQNLETLTDPLGAASAQLDDYSTLWTYDAAGQKVVERRRERTSTASKDLITSWAYDNRGNVRAVADPIRNATAPSTPELNASDDLRGKQRMRFTYDKVDNLKVAAEDPSGKNLRTYRCYDAHDNVQAVTDARGSAPACPAASGAGFTTRMEYDGRDALVDRYDAAGNRTHYDVRGDGQIEKITKPRGTATALADDYTTALTYDSAGDLIRRSLPWAQGQYLDSTKGLGFDYTRNAVGDAVTIRDARGKSFTNTYFDTGDIKSTTRPGFWAVDANGVRERGPGEPPVEQALKKAASNDAKGDFGSVDPEQFPGMLPKSGPVAFDYDNEMRLRTVTETAPAIDLARRQHVLDRDVLGRVIKHTMPFGNGPNDLAGTAPRTIVNQYFYDRRDLRRVRDGENFDTTFTYDQFGRRLTVTTPGSATATETTTTAYDDNDNVSLVTTPRVTRRQYFYDSVDRLNKQIAPDLGVTTFDYDAVGNRTYKLPPRGQNVPETEKPKYAEHRTYNALNQLTTLERGRFPSPDTRSSTYVYDADGNQTQVTAPGAAPSGTTPQPRITKRKFDARGLLWTQTTGSGIYERTRATEHDANGNLRRVVSPAGVTRAADPLPRHADPGTLPDGQSGWSEHSTVFTYDDDNLLGSTYLPWGSKDDADKERWRQHVERDSRGRIRVIQAPHVLGSQAKKLTTYRYFDNGWIRSSVDALTVRADDDAGPNAGEHMLRYDYDKRGNQTLWKSEAKNRQVRRTFFPNGLLKERFAEKPDEKIRGYSYQYDPNGSMTKMVDDQATPATPGDDRVSNFTYDPNDRPLLTNEVRPPTSDGESEPRDTLIAYDIGGNVTSRKTDGTWNAATSSYAGGKTTAFTYDAQDRELTMTVTQNGESGSRSRATTWWPSDDAKQHVRKRPDNNSVTENRFYTDDGRLLSRTRAGNSYRYKYDDEANSGTSSAAWGNGRRIEDERGAYVFNARDQLRKWTLTENNVNFVYTFDPDGSGAIRKTTGPEGNRFFFYEGDRVKCERTAAPPDPLQPCVGAETSYEYNAFDNVTKIRSTDERKRKQYGYDGFERLTSTGPLDGADKTRYDYDALDRRDARYDVAANNKRYDYSYVGATEALAREDAKVGTEAEVRSYDYDSGLQRVGQARKKAGGAFDYRGYAISANGDVQGLEAADGSFEGDSYTLNPYGESRRDPSTEAASANPFRFQGHYFDDDLQAYDMRARMYRPELGSFLSPDRYESSTADLGLQLDPRTNNRFSFLAGNPVDDFEIDGHEPLSTFNPNGRQELTDSDGKCFRDCDDDADWEHMDISPPPVQGTNTFAPFDSLRRAPAGSAAGRSCGDACSSANHPPDTPFTIGPGGRIERPPYCPLCEEQDRQGVSEGEIVAFLLLPLAASRVPAAPRRGSGRGGRSRAEDAPLPGYASRPNRWTPRQPNQPYATETVLDPAKSRVKLRVDTRKKIQEAQPKTADGDYIDPNTGTVIPKDGPLDYGHKPGYEWWRTQQRAREEGWTREEVIEFENNPRHYQIEDPSSNRSHKYEMPR